MKINKLIAMCKSLEYNSELDPNKFALQQLIPNVKTPKIASINKINIKKQTV